MPDKPTPTFIDRIDSVMNAVGNVLSGRPLRSAILKVRHTRQRVKRGWDDTATWSLDVHLARTLGAQLKHLANTSHGYPSGVNFQSFEDWQAALNLHGDALTNYANEIFNYDLDENRHAQLIEDAQAALRWVADNLVSLWD